VDSSDATLYREYRSQRGDEWIYRAIVERYFPPLRDSRILDLGCGNGALLQSAHAMGYANLRGVDRSPRQIADARASYICEGDLFEFIAACPDRSQDVICTFDVIEHLMLPDNLTLAKEVWRVLDTGGRWILHTVNGASPMSGRVLFNDLTHKWSFTPGSIQQLLSSAGFVEMEFYEERPVVHGTLSLARAILWRLVRLVPLAWLAIESGVTNAILTPELCDGRLQAVASSAQYP